MTRRDDSKAETRELILTTARSLFWDKGPDKCTVRDIAQEAGVSPASIIVHFKNKTALLEATLYEEIEKNLGIAMATLPVNKGISAVLMHIASTMLAVYDRNRDLYRILIRDTYFEPVQESPTLSQLDEKYFAFLASLIDQEKAAGRVQHEIDSNLAAYALFNLYLGVLRNYLTDTSLSIAETKRRLAGMLEQYLNGILVQGEKS